MVAEWHIKAAECRMAAKVCARVYEELNDFIEELQIDLDDGGFDGLRIETLYQFKERLIEILPFDPEEV